MTDLTAKRAARERIRELVVEDKQRKSLINAYLLKKHVIEDKLIETEQPENYQIRTSDPIIVPPEGKYTHTQGALISSKPYSPPRVRLCCDEPMCPGPSSCPFCRFHVQHLSTASPGKPRPSIPSNSPLVRKLTSLEAFPTTYQKRIESSLNENENGDIVDMSKKTSKLLKDASASSLYTPTRASDFRSEIRWRLMLRDSN